MDADSLLVSLVLRDAVDRLPDNLRAVVALRFAGYTQQECAGVLGMTRANIGAMHKRALLRLAETMGGAR